MAGIENLSDGGSKMIDKHELLGFECLESRHTFAVEDVALIEFTTTDGRSGHFWYDSHVDPSPYEGVVIKESYPTTELLNSNPYSYGNLMGQQLVVGVVSVDTETGFVFDNQQYQDPSVRIRHDLGFDSTSRKIRVYGETIELSSYVPNQNGNFLFSYYETEPTYQYLSDVLREPVLPKSLLEIDAQPDFGWVSNVFRPDGQPLNPIVIRSIREIPVLDLALQRSFSDQDLSITVNAFNIDSRVTVNEFQPDDDVRFYWSSNETTAGILSEVPSEIFGQSAASRYSTTVSASIDSIQNLAPSNANSIIAIIDNNDNILEKNEFNNVLAIPLSEFLVDDGSVQLSYDSFGRLYADGQPVRIQNQYAASAIGGFEVVSATDEGGNQLIVKKDSTQYRLIADDVWRINGLFDSLQNDSTAILDISARESSSTLNLFAVAGAYEINGVKNPTLVVRRGQTYTFNLNAADHPFYLQTIGGGYQSTKTYANGFTGNNRTNGEYRWVVPQDAPDEVFYQCKFHPVMFGKIIVVD